MPDKVNLIDTMFIRPDALYVNTALFQFVSATHNNKYFQSAMNPNYSISDDDQPFEWDRMGTQKYNKSVFVVDGCIGTHFKDYPNQLEWSNSDDLHVDASIVESQTRVAWLNENKAIYPKTIELMKELEDSFDYILTHEDELLSRGDKYLPMPMVHYFLQDNNITDFTKSKLVSMLSSDRNVPELLGHALRHSIRDTYSGRFDLYGRETNPVDCTSMALKDYRFAIVVENNKQPHYFTEKLLDCLACKTIPIYYGATPENYGFDANGILSFSTVEELGTILDSLSEELYNSKLDAVESNYNLTRGKFSSAEKFIHTEYPFLFD